MGFDHTTSWYHYGEFSARPENTHSYVLKLTTCIITNIIIYIFHNSWTHWLFDVNLRDYASHICVYKIVYLIQFLFLNIAFLFTCMDLAREITDVPDHYNLQVIDSSQLLILSNGWTLDMEQVTKYMYMRWISAPVR